MLQKLQKTPLRLVLITMYKALVRPHLDYGNMVCSEAYNKTFHEKLESAQYNNLSSPIRSYYRIIKRNFTMN